MSDKSDPHLPFVSIIIVNYNGRRWLGDCLSSLSSLDYPSDRYEVILVDNHSSDGSLALVEEHYPWVRIISSPRNLGFAGGNNLGIRSSRGEMVVLLNNDTVVDKKWLVTLVERALEGGRIGAVGSKLLFFYPHLPIHLSCRGGIPRDMGLSSDGRHLGCKLREVWFGGQNITQEVRLVQEFYSWEKDERGPFRWTASESLLALPIKKETAEVLLTLEVEPLLEEDEVVFSLDGLEIGRFRVQGRQKVELNVSLSERCTDIYQRWLVNSTGTILTPEVYAADRGFQSLDQGQFERAEEVFGACGASVLIKKEMLKDVGLFEDEFFMYYEDVDLFWRARLRGWQIMYEPRSVVRHIHCGSSQEWSPLFTYHVLRNRLLMILRVGWPSLVLKSWLKYYLSLALLIILALRSVILRRGRVDEYLGLRLRVAGDLFLRLPGQLVQRFSIRRGRRVHDREIARWMVRPGEIMQLEH